MTNPHDKLNNELLKKLDEIKTLRDKLSLTVVKLFQSLQWDVIVLDKNPAKLNRYQESIGARLQRFSSTLKLFLSLFNSKEQEEEEEESAAENLDFRMLQANAELVVSCKSLVDCPATSDSESTSSLSPQTEPPAQSFNSTSKLQSMAYPFHENSMKDVNGFQFPTDIEKVGKRKAHEYSTVNVEWPQGQEDVKPRWNSPLTGIKESKCFPGNSVEFPTIPEFPLNDCMELKAIVTHVISPSCFFLQPLCSELHQMMADYNLELNKGKVEISFLPSVGSFTWACFTEDDSWYRAQVLAFADNQSNLLIGEQDLQAVKVHVMYVDYGNQEWLSLSQLRYLEPKFAELPRQAIATSLAYVCPTQEVVWTSRQVQWFIDRIQSCTMYAVLYCLQGTCFSVLHNAPKVDGYFRVQSNIASMMLMEGMASCSSFMKYSGSPWLLNSAYVHSGMTPKSPDQFSLPRVFMKHSNECQGIQQDNEDSLYPEGCVHTPLEDNKDFQANEASPSLAQTCLVENGVDGNMVGHTSRMGSVHVAQNSEISTSDAAQTQVVSSSTVVLHDSDNDKRREQVDNFNNSCQKSTRAKETSLEKTNSLEQTNGDNFVPPKLPEDDSCHRNGVTNIGLQSVDPLTEDARSEFLLMVKGGLKTRRFSENQEHSFYFTMSHIVTPSEFYIHLREEVVLFKLLQEELQHIYSSTSASLNFDGSTQDMPGSLCCVLHEESLTWCRGKIVGFKMDAIMDQDCFFVFLLDSGNSLWFTRNQLRVLLPTFHDVPGFAVKCCLHNIRAANANSHWNVWNHEAVHHFTKLTGFSTVFLGDVLFINVQDFLEIIVKDTTQLLPININEEMVSSGLAIYIEPPKPLHSQNVLQPVPGPADEDRYAFHQRSAPLSHLGLFQPAPSLKGELNNEEEAFGEDCISDYLASFTSTLHGNLNDETDRRHDKPLMTFIEKEYNGISSMISTGGGNIKKHDNIIDGNDYALQSKAHQNNGLKDDPANMNDGLDVVQSDAMGRRAFLNEDVEAVMAQSEQIPCDLKTASVKFSKMLANVGPPTSWWEREIAAIEPRKMPLDAEAAEQIERNVWATVAVAVQPGSVSCHNTGEEQSGSLVCDVGVAAAMYPGRFPHHDSHPDLISFDIEVEDVQQKNMQSDMSSIVAEATMKTENIPCDIQPGRIPCGAEASVMQSGNIPFEFATVTACLRMVQRDDKAAGKQTAHLPYTMEEAKMQSDSMSCDVGAAAVQQYRIPYAIDTSLMQPQRVTCNVEATDPGNNQSIKVASARMQPESKPGNITAALQPDIKPCNVGILMLQSERMPCDMDTSSTGTIPVHQETMLHGNGGLQMPPEVLLNYLGAPLQPQIMPMTVGSPGSMLWNQTTTGLQPEKVENGFGSLAVQPGYMPCDVGELSHAERTAYEVELAVLQPKRISNENIQAERVPCDVVTSTMWQQSMQSNFGQSLIQQREQSIFETTELLPISMRYNVEASVKQPKEMSPIKKAAVQIEMMPRDVEPAVVRPSTSCKFDLAGLHLESVHHHMRAEIMQPGRASCDIGTAVQQEIMASNGVSSTKSERKVHNVGAVVMKYRENEHYDVGSEATQQTKVYSPRALAMQPHQMPCDFVPPVVRQERTSCSIDVAMQSKKIPCDFAATVPQPEKMPSHIKAATMHLESVSCGVTPAALQPQRTRGDVALAATTVRPENITSDAARAVVRLERMPCCVSAATLKSESMSCDFTTASALQPESRALDFDSDNCLGSWDPMHQDFCSEWNNYAVDSERLSVALSTGFVIPDKDNACRLWKRGHCWRGKACRFEHALPDPTGLMGMVEEVFQETRSLDLPFAGSWIFLQVTAIHNPCHFWVQLPHGCQLAPQILTQQNLYSLHSERTATLESYTSMLQDLQKYYLQNRLHHRRQTLPASGELVAARLSSNGLFYRGRVYDVNPEAMFSVKVFFVDLGSTEWLKEDDVLQLRPEFLHVPFQAVEVYLHELELVRAENSRRLARELFENIVEEKLMVAQVMRRSLADELWVILYLVENSTAISINHWFLDMGFCVLQQPRQQDQDRQGTKLALKLYPG